MFSSLPSDGLKTMDWPWSRFEPYYSDLADRSISDENAEGFLKDWSKLSELVDETYSRLHVANTLDTSDKEAEAAYHKFLDDIFPKSAEAEQTLKQKFLETGIETAGFEVPLRAMRTEAEIFRQENLPLITREQKLNTEYAGIMGKQTVQWEGREVTLTALSPVFQEPDRERREQAWRLAGDRRMQDRDSIGRIWQDLMDLRLKMASNAGFQDYRSFRWKQMQRFDYTPDDCRSFHAAIERVVVPAAGRIYGRRQAKLGLDKLRPWDTEVDPMGRPALKPFTDVAKLKAGSSAIFNHVDPQLGDHFDKMVREDLLDLDNRKNKAPGGYCTEFPAVKRPFIFMNAVGVHNDVQTLLHEAGHCFHVFESAHLPYYAQTQVGMEFAEVASMAMELLAAPYLARSYGGFYSDAEAGRARIEHLERSILFWPYMAVVDAFQHWIYENPAEGRDPSACDEQWTALHERFMPFIDWTGLESNRRSIWQRQLHIIEYPFYYVEYGLAQLGAVQVWSNALSDQKAAVAGYRRGLALGGSAPLPDLFQAAGARLAFDDEVLLSAVGLMERKIEDLERA